MEEVQSAPSAPSSSFATTSTSKYDELIDIPVTTKIIAQLISLFNYFDIYAPRMQVLHDVVTIFRFFQLIGGAFMAANLNSFEPGTFTFNVMSVITVFFHLVPLQYRRNRAYIVLSVVNSILIVFAIYLVVTAYLYKKTSKVPEISTKILSIFMAVGPNLLVPISAQFSAQILSGNIVKTVPIDFKNVYSVITSFLVMIVWTWIIVKAYSKALVFRPTSFASIEGSPQVKLLITTTFVTFASSLTSWFGSYASAAMILVSLLFYIYCSTTVFNCGSFIRKQHQVMVLSGSIIGFILCAANLYTIFADTPWGPYFFLGFVIISLIVFILVSFYFRKRISKELRLLDEFDDTNDITILKNPKKMKQLLSTGFNYCHPTCVSFKIFKICSEEWKDSLDIWAMYSKFVAIYPELSGHLSFVAQNIYQLKTKDTTLQTVILDSTNYIIKTRETRFTQQLKHHISKISKNFNKAKAKIRNIWDLTLQGNINEMKTAVERTRDSIYSCEVEINHLLMQFPNNRFVLRQYVNFLSEIKGDPIKAKSALDNLYKLQRGISISSDTIHELGMEAFPNMPDICNDMNDQSKIDNESLNVTDDINFDDTINVEAVESISKMIDNHKVPSIRYIYLSTSLIFIFMILVPLIIICCFFIYFKNEIEKPIRFMEGIAYTRNIVSILTAYLGRFFFQELDDPYNMSQKIQGEMEIDYDLDLSAFGNYFDTRDIIRYVASLVSDANEKMSEMRSYKPKNKVINEIKNRLFTNVVNFSYYLNNTYSENTMTTVSEVSYMVANHVGKLCDLTKITPEVAKSPDSLTARHNNIKGMNQMTTSLELLLTYLKNENTNYQKYFVAIIIATISLVVIVFPIVYFMQIKKLRENRHEVLFTLTLLPKTVISSISASLNKIKDESKSMNSQIDNEFSRQEDSIIKLFATISDGSGNSSFEVANLICFILLVVAACFGYFVTMNCYIKSAKNLVYNSNHINYLLGATTFLFSIFASTFKVSLAKYHPIFNQTIVSLNEEVSNVKTRVSLLTNYFQMIRLGGTDPRDVPFPEMKTYIDKASAALVCNGITKPPTSVVQSVHCFSSAQQLYVANMYMLKYVGMMYLKDPIYPKASDPLLKSCWQIGPLEIYSEFLYKAGDQIVPLIINGVSEQQKNQIIYAVVFVMISLIICLVIIAMAKKQDALFRFILSLFLRCPPMTVLNNQRIVDLLSGKYNENKEENSELKHIGFSNEIVNRLNDIIIVCQEETGKIISVNNAFEEMFNIKQNNVENTLIKDFFTKEKFQNMTDKFFTQTSNLVYVNSEEEKVYLEFNSSLISGRRIFSGSNQTQNVLHEKLIEEEKKKSDSMLASILPPMLVHRVQMGEKNISFSVQSVTVLFLDVVEFTPWCGSHDAQYVMRMLNIMFKEFDAITNAHKTMTKIKCIGDCYMAAGGVFDEVNQPAVHAKEVVDFGCLVIKKLMDIDENEKENLRIRVGINTGGPIVAGVIGTEKPTFEILGPAINIAHEMESKGVPMKVHISRPVYELIYGQSFDIKERGEIDVKGGKMFTYIVEP